MGGIETSIKFAKRTNKRDIDKIQSTRVIIFFFLMAMEGGEERAFSWILRS